MPLPLTAYVLLWFPKPSETFIFREVMELWRLGLPLKVYTLYGPLRRDLCPEMRALPMPVERLGLRNVGRTFLGLAHWLARAPRTVRRLWRQVPWRLWRGWESGGENLLAFWCGFHLARRLLEDGVQHIHAPWARGTATAAWVASRLTGIPFSFTGRAHDLQPPDGAFADKLAAASFLRCESLYAMGRLGSLEARYQDKVLLTYNGMPLPEVQSAPVAMRPPYRLLALGRMVAFKGFGDLIQACALLNRAGLDFRLTLAGDGPLRSRLQRQTQRLGLSQKVTFPGFVPLQGVSALFTGSDIFVMPSVVDRHGGSDGLPTVILEALAHGLPVIATDVAGIAEVLQPGLTGWLVPPGQPAALARAVLEVIADRAHALELARAGREWVRRDFDARRNCRRIMELYGQFSGPEPAPGQR